jgi:16S rRNA processing protein RimM
MASVRIGRIGRAHGLNGEVTLDDCDLTAEELSLLGSVTWRGRGGDERTLAVQAVRPVLGRLLVHFRGIDDRDRARELGLGELSADSERLPDPGPGMAYAFQLIGLAVETEDGRRLGVLESVLSTGANPVYVVQGEREWLVPATPEVVRRVDLTGGVITVALPAGLEDL